MFTIKHILFPIDFSERSCGAAPFVHSMARRFRADVTLLSVATRVPYYGMEAMMLPSDEELKADAEKRLEGALERELADVPVQRIVEVGEPAAVITSFAHNRGIDLIMIPTHGYGPFRRLLLGSVTAKVLHDAECPVWTGAHMEAHPPLEHVNWRSVLCAVDGMPGSEGIISWAFAFARQAGAMFRLLHVVPGIEPWLEHQFDRDFEQDLRERARNKIEKMLEGLEIDAPLCIGMGSVADAVRDEAAGHGTDLIIIGRGTRREGLGRLRTHAYNIIREAPCPVISV